MQIVSITHLLALHVKKELNRSHLTKSVFNMTVPTPVQQWNGQQTIAIYVLPLSFSFKKIVLPLILYYYDWMHLYSLSFSGLTHIGSNQSYCSIQPLYFLYVFDKIKADVNKLQFCIFLFNFRTTPKTRTHPIFRSYLFL